MFVLSRRISVARMRSGRLSQQRAERYTCSSSNRIQTSVRSLAGAPATGSFWMNPVSGGMRA